MNVGKRHHPALDRARALFASTSVIALLALVCFPVFAHAECVSSSCVQYTEAIPNSEGENPSTPHKHPAVAKAADNGGASAPTDKAGKPASNGAMEEAGENESSSKEGGMPATGNGGGTGQGNPGASANHDGTAPQAQHGGQNAGTPASHSSSSSSSPLIPILIGIAVLAAISVGVVMYRQRRQRRGPTASAPSPKAG